MAGPIAIVTDSTAYLPPELIDQYGITVVPVQVVIGGRSYAEGVDISVAQVAKALREWQPVSTSRPAPADFIRAYQEAAAAGAQAIVSAHLSARLSGTYECALLASRESPVPVEVIDSRTTAMALGYACISGAEAAAAGAGVAEVAAAVRGRAAASMVYFLVESLDYLRRGGRIGTASAMVGAALRVRPILGVTDGQVTLIEKARTASRALGRVAELSVEFAAGRDVDVAVQSLDGLEASEQLALDLESRMPGLQVLRGDIGAVIGTHAGPGIVAAVIAPRSW